MQQGSVKSIRVLKAIRITMYLGPPNDPVQTLGLVGTSSTFKLLGRWGPAAQIYWEADLRGKPQHVEITNIMANFGRP